jgi:hypothetical protein
MMNKERSLLKNLKRTAIKKLDFYFGIHKFLAKKRAKILVNKWYVHIDSNKTGENQLNVFDRILLKTIEFAMDEIEDAGIGPSLDEYENRVKAYEEYAKKLSDAISELAKNRSVPLPISKLTN